MKTTVTFFLTAVIALLVFSEKSYAIPAFARKYKTSCATCHNGFPKLTPFGEAFRRSGYQFPGGTDAEYVKEEAIPMGAEGYKKVFPDAIWPGSLPATSPISLFFNGEIDYNPKYDPADATSAERVSFNGLGNSIEAVAAGTIGDDISFWGHAILSSDGSLELNRMFLIFSNLIGDSYALNARVGVIEPSLFSFSTHRAWMEGYWITTRQLSNDMAWSFEETQKGIELNGVQGRLGYSAGIVEGFGSLHSDKDYYGHITYKIGGLPLDGVVEGGSAANNTKPYIDNSITFGALAYLGTAVIQPDSLPGLPMNNFKVFGGDFNAFYDRYNLFGGLTVRNDDAPIIGMNKSVSTTTWFAELDVTVYPWLLPGIRFESWSSSAPDPENPGALISYTDSQIVPGIIALVRPNLKMTLRARFSKMAANSTDGNGNPIFLAGSSYQAGQVQLLMTIGI
jgi:hypothetical protein